MRPARDAEEFCRRLAEAGERERAIALWKAIKRGELDAEQRRTLGQFHAGPPSSTEVAREPGEEESSE